MRGELAALSETHVKISVVRCGVFRVDSAHPTSHGHSLPVMTHYSRPLVGQETCPSSTTDRSDPRTETHVEIGRYCTHHSQSARGAMCSVFSGAPALAALADATLDTLAFHRDRTEVPTG